MKSQKTPAYDAKAPLKSRPCSRGLWCVECGRGSCFTRPVGEKRAAKGDRQTLSQASLIVVSISRSAWRDVSTANFFFFKWPLLFLTVVWFYFTAFRRRIGDLVNPLTPKIKDQIPLSFPRTFSYSPWVILSLILMTSEVE